MRRTRHSDNRSGSTRIYYDTLPIEPWTYPLSTEVIKMWGRYAPKWISFADNFTKVSMAVRLDDGTIYDNLGFTTWDEFKWWIDQNIPYSEGEFQKFSVDLYDDVDTQIPKLSRMYGQNRLFSLFAGRRGYRTAHSGINCIDPGMNYLLMKMFHSQHPWSAGWLDYAIWMAGSWAPTVWSNRRDLRRYGITPVGHADTAMYTIYPSGGTRHYVCENFEGVHPVVPVFADQPCVVENTKLFIYYGSWPIPQPTTAYSIYDVYNNEYERRKARAHISSDVSSLLFSRVRLPFNGENNWAMYVKPVGIDTVYLNYFDTTKYALEAVCFNKARQIEFQDITSLILRQDAVSDSTQISKSAWIWSPFTCENIYEKKSFVQPYMVRFRLRDRATNKVGELSQSCIKPGKEHKFVPLTWITEPVI